MITEDEVKITITEWMEEMFHGAKYMILQAIQLQKCPWIWAVGINYVSAPRPFIKTTGGGHPYNIILLIWKDVDSEKNRAERLLEWPRKNEEFEISQLCLQDIEGENPSIFIEFKDVPNQAQIITRSIHMSLMPTGMSIKFKKIYPDYEQRGGQIITLKTKDGSNRNLQ